MTSANRTVFLDLADRMLEELGGEPSGLGDAERAAPRIGIRFVVDGVELTLLHADEPEVDELFLLECALGPLPAESRQDALRRLLELNFVMSSTALVGFAVDSSDRAVFAQSHAMRKWSAHSLVQLIAGLVDMASLWQETAFQDLLEIPSLVSAEPGLFIGSPA